MTEKLIIKKVDEVYVKIHAEASTSYELSDYFTFTIPNAQFHPKVKAKIWDGKIRLYNVLTKQLYAGLTPLVEKFASDRGYEVEYEYNNAADNFSVAEAKQFIKELELPHVPYDHQIDAFVYGVRNRRALLISPTASGKSLIIYLLARFLNEKTLIIVPSISLVHQLAGDFADYGYTSKVYKITGGVDKKTNCDITVTTWQSIAKQPKEWFDQFGAVFGDEAHLFKATSLVSIMTKLTKCKYRYGLTGTLDGTLTNKLVLEGLFGRVKKVISTTELMEKKHVSNLLIKAIVLTYPEEVCKEVKKASYQEEMDFIVRKESRNKFIKNLALSLQGNTLILYQYVEKHGEVLYNLIKDNAGDRPVFFVHGGVDGEEREEIRHIVEKESNAIIVASYGTMSTGTNIKNLHNLIFASPSKSIVRILQSIGRALRKSSTKSIATLFDIADDLSYKSHTNHTANHYRERIKIYATEGFDFKTYKVGIE